MALTQTLTQLRDATRRIADAKGTTALARHPDTDVNDYVNRGLGSIYRILQSAIPDQRYLSTTTITFTAGVSTYALPSTFDHLISVELSANGVKTWLIAYEMHERAMLTDPSATYEGVPFTYRLRGGNIEFLPTPQSAYSAALWFVPSVSQLTGSDTWDTISRLDDYVTSYAARLIAIRDKNWDLAGALKALLDELRLEVQTVARARDKNSPSRIVDESYADRWGRRRRFG